MTRFTSADVVRHPLVARIVDAYEAHQNQAEAQGQGQDRGHGRPAHSQSRASNAET
jgi:phosphate starvation-inducible PhoH-like protein